KNHNVLEIGSGIGTLTTLLAKYVKRGKVHGTDISAKSIEMARHNLSAYKQVTMHVTDMSDFSVNEKFDFVVMPDVLEHIPVEQHENLFKVIAAHSHKNTKILIHIPHPEQIKIQRKLQPEAMQIIDQSIFTDRLLSVVYPNGFYLHKLHSYSLFHENPDYQMIVFKANNEYTHLNTVSKGSVIRRKWLRRLYFMFS
ncbi:MAG: class I SAM-dependent methyltransferase, partial [Bacteroidota bacterium]